MKKVEFSFKDKHGLTTTTQYIIMSNMVKHCFDIRCKIEKSYDKKFVCLNKIPRFINFQFSKILCTTLNKSIVDSFYK